MNLQQLIDSRQSLNDLQYQSLLDMLAYRQGNAVREAIKASLRCKFYTIFDQLPLSKKITVRDDHLELSTRNLIQAKQEVKLLRELVIATGEL
jgi:hypothetical protein